MVWWSGQNTKEKVKWAGIFIPVSWWDNVFTCLHNFLCHGPASHMPKQTPLKLAFVMCFISTMRKATNIDVYLSCSLMAPSIYVTWLLSTPSKDTANLCLCIIDTHLPATQCLKMADVTFSACSPHNPLSCRRYLHKWTWKVNKTPSGQFPLSQFQGNFDYLNFTCPRGKFDHS